MKKLLMLAVAAAIGAGAFGAPEAVVTGDFTKVVRPLRAMHGVGQPPFIFTQYKMFKYLQRAGIPYSRLHDVGGWLGGGLWVDIPNLFRNFDADETKEENYDFAFTDDLVRQLLAHGVEPFFRLGVTIENRHDLRSYRIHPPKDFAKWARICEHVIRHYTEGWANGMKAKIDYWEIWNEADGGSDDPARKSGTWSGTPEQYFEFHAVAARHLKAKFPKLRIGGPALAWDLKWADRFLGHMAAHQVPLDFFSWHCYGTPGACVKRAQDVRKLLEKHGYGAAEDIMNEWNPGGDRANPATAAKVMAVMLEMQKKTTTSVLCYYDARFSPDRYAGLFNPDTWRPSLAYYPFVAFNEAYKLGGEVATGTNKPDQIAVLGASGKGRRILLLANVGGEVSVRLDLTGVDLANVQVLRIDGENTLTLTGEGVADGKISLPAGGSAMIVFL